MSKREMYIDFIKANKDLPNRTLARIMQKEFKNNFKDIEAARTIIRMLRGSSGNKIKTGYEPDPDLVRSPEEIDSWRGKLPKAESNPYPIYTIPESIKKWLMLYDTHSPYHDEKALWAAIMFGKKEKCDGVFEGGDNTDCYQCSNFIRDPRKRSLIDEVYIKLEIDRAINKEIKPKKRLWKLGNHEYRLDRYIMTRTPELLGLDGISFPSIFKTKEHGIDIILNSSLVKYKTLNILHGNEYGSGFILPVNPARGMFLKARENVICGHSHITSEHTETTLNDTTITCWSVGCLAHLKPDYKPFNKYNHGFGILSIGPGKFWKFKNYRIIDGEVV